jgi:hypothetical protein
VLTKTTDEDQHHQLHQQSFQSILDSCSHECPYLLNEITSMQIMSSFHSYLPISPRLLGDIGCLTLLED